MKNELNEDCFFVSPIFLQPKPVATDEWPGGTTCDHLLCVYKLKAFV